MIWAIKDNRRIKALPNTKALCPMCKQELIPKCGEVKIWHWSHKSNKDCDDWYEPESEWHLKWKNEFPKEQQEVIISKKGKLATIDLDYDYNGNVVSRGEVFFEAPLDLDEELLKNCDTIIHRADIQTKTGTIIEIQSSPISLKDVRAREEFYGDKLIWLLNGQTFGKNLELGHWVKGQAVIGWNWKPAIVKHSKRPVFIDLGYAHKNQILKYHQNRFKSQFFTKEQFLQVYGDIYKFKEVEDGKQTNLLR